MYCIKIILHKMQIWFLFWRGLKAVYSISKQHAHEWTSVLEKICNNFYFIGLF